MAPQILTDLRTPKKLKNGNSNRHGLDDNDCIGNNWNNSNTIYFQRIFFRPGKQCNGFNAAGNAIGNTYIFPSLKSNKTKGGLIWSINEHKVCL